MSAAVLTDDQRYGAALAALEAPPELLRMFLDSRDPADAWEAIALGRHRADPDGRYRHRATPETLARVVDACVSSSVSVMVLGGPEYPRALAHDGQAPAVLFSRGEVGVLEGRPRVAVVGTRWPTAYGLGMAVELGRDLARAGVVVLSGATTGIDAAAHGGALGVRDGAPTVGILGIAPDAVVTRAEKALHDALVARGAVLSEVAPGGGSPPGARHRVTAALAHVVVVVECHRRDGSLRTVAAAAARGVTVTVVPGSVRSLASAGTNLLLVDGAVPVRDVDDVLAAVELAVAARPEITPPRRPRAAPHPGKERVRTTPYPGPGSGHGPNEGTRPRMAWAGAGTGPVPAPR